MTRLFWVWAAVLACICGQVAPAFAADELTRAAPPALCAWDDEAYRGLRRTDAFAPGEVALTFDDGPQPVATKKLLDVLDAHGYTATFFVVGSWVRADTYHLIQRMVTSGHEIGTHTYHDAVKEAFERLAKDPTIHVTTLRRAVATKYACGADQLYASLHPRTTVAAREAPTRLVE